jgi:hypothetical protein
LQGDELFVAVISSSAIGCGVPTCEAVSGFGKGVSSKPGLNIGSDRLGEANSAGCFIAIEGNGVGVWTPLSK